MIFPCRTWYKQTANAMPFMIKIKVCLQYHAVNHSPSHIRAFDTFNHEPRKTKIFKETQEVLEEKAPPAPSIHKGDKPSFQVGNVQQQKKR